MNLIDTPYNVQLAAPKIKAAGYGGVIRYISPSTKMFPNKRISLAEVQTLRSLSMAVGFVWETTSSADIMTPANGVAHARSAVTVLQSFGVPANVGIFLAVDHDALSHELDEIESYFQAAQPIIKQAGYLVGVYGSGLVCDDVHQKGYAHYTWLAQSKGWAGFNSFKSKAHIVQGVETKVASLGVDLDYAQVTPTAAGLWV